MAQVNSLVVFLVDTFTISLAAFGLMVMIPEARSPEGLPGLPIWFVAVWSPSIMAIIVAYRAGKLHDLFRKLVAFQEVGWAWIIVLLACGVLVAALLLNRQVANWDALTPSLLLLLVGFNLVLGPLGEELGWRGYLQPTLQSHLGWFGATLTVAVFWAVWHAPLWLIDTPQSEIPFLIFCIHILAYSFIMASAHLLAPNSLLPAVLLHLIFNVASGLVLILGVASTAEWYTWSAPGYVITAVIVTLVTYWPISTRVVTP